MFVFAGGFLSFLDGDLFKLTRYLLLLARWYLKYLGGQSKIHSVVGVGPLFGGTTFNGLITILKGLNFHNTLASLVSPFCEACTQVVEGSDFLTELHKNGSVIPFPPRRSRTDTTPPPPPPSTKYLMVVTSHDEVVTPFTSGYLDNDQVKHVVMEDICPDSAKWVGRHWALMFSPITFAIVDSFLTPADARSQIDCFTT